MSQQRRCQEYEDQPVTAAQGIKLNHTKVVTNAVIEC